MISSSTATNVPSSSSIINNNSELNDPIIVDYVSDISDSEDNLHHQNINTNQSTFINEINDSDTTITTTTAANTNTTTTSSLLDNNNNIIIENSSPTLPLSSTIETLKSSSNNNSSSSSSTKQESNHHEDENSEDNMWSCNICFDTASEPVITQCGHLYCWSCIYRWMQSHSTQNLQCPVCKAGIQQDKLIPIYGRGHSNNSNSNSNSNSNGSTTTTNNNDNIPQRPRGQYTDSRTTPNPNYNPFHNMTNLFGNFNTNNNVMGGGFHSTNQFLFSDAFRFFPFFDLAGGGGGSNNSTGNNLNNNRNHPLVPPPTEQEELQGFVRRLALFLGFILLFYIIFI